MMRVAYLMIVGERGKYLGLVVDLAFTSFVMTQQPAMFFGIMRSITSLIDGIDGVDVWVMDPTCGKLAAWGHLFS